MISYLFWVLLILLFVIRFYTSQPIYKDKESIRISTKVTSEPIVYDTSQYIKIEGLKIYLPKYPEVGYGDRIIVEGKVDKQKNILANSKLISLEESKGVIYKIREKLISFFRKALPEPHSSLVAGVVIGSKSSIPADFWESLKKTGTAHVVVASGMNVTLVAGFLINFLILFFSRKKAVLFALAGIWVYAVISGFDAPIIRAAIMGSIAFSAMALGRINFAWRALFISGLTMLILRPLWITDLGFILSFSATLSLLVFGGYFGRIFSKLKLPREIKEGFQTTLAAQVLVAPILYYTFGYYSIWSPLVNALVLWTIPFMTVIGMLAGFIGLIWFDFGRIVLYLTYPLTSWFIWVTNGIGF